LRGRTAPVNGLVPGITGAAAMQAAGVAGERFRQIAAQRNSQAAVDAASLHTAWGVFFNANSGKGLQATHSVVNVTTKPTESLYAPTALPPGGACSELTTAYVSSGPVLWAWDWCSGRDTIGKLVKMDAAFMSTYTTVVNGSSAYSEQEIQTTASNNTWTTYLYNYVTHAWDTFYSSSGTPDLSANQTWDFFEVYTSIDPSTGAGYYCKDANGKAFEASDIKVNQNGSWVAASTANSSLSRPPAGSAFDCPSLTFTTVHANDHWLGQIGPPTSPTTPPTTSPTSPGSPSPTATPTGPASPACTATYKQTNAWQGGFQGEVTVTAGSAGTRSWSVRLGLPAGTAISQAWNGTLSGNSPNYTVASQTYNGPLAAGASTTFGFLATGTAAAPTLACTNT
jgi:hypothetical protein